MIDEPITSFNPAENLTKSATINDKLQSVVDVDFDNPMITANDCMNSETSNDDYLSQSPLNLTRSQGLLSYIPTLINTVVCIRTYMFCMFILYTCIRA